MKTIDGVEKPLEEWTATEIQKFCRFYNRKMMGKYCEDSCPIYGKICLQECVLYWNLSEKPKFTEQEIEAAKAIKLLFGDCSIIKDEKCKKVHIVYYDSRVSSGSMEISIFPSIENLKSYKISEIIGDADA